MVSSASVQLTLAQWARLVWRRYDASRSGSKHYSGVIPALNEAATIGDVVRSPTKPGPRGWLNRSRAMAKLAGGECLLKQWRSPIASILLGLP
jgi:hypothetical protein